MTCVVWLTYIGLILGIDAVINRDRQEILCEENWKEGAKPLPNISEADRVGPQHGKAQMRDAHTERKLGGFDISD
ncbi:hypothetical protein B0I37DRAFT_73065 [Chaetomium sp. MPI-CAGE-AT-0009]|nr:hypothetical protein B0I37DRAFT_73065 [Chaetomium sp. MPI-CAGE-AT-0009]